MDLLIDGIACALLVRVVVEDLRRFRIRNGAVLGLVALFVLSCVLDQDWEALLWHGAFGAAALVLMFGAFALGLLGAGDAKLMAVVCVWVGPERSTGFSLALLLLTVVYCVGAKLGYVPILRDDRSKKIPFGPSIAGACIATIVLARVGL